MVFASSADSPSLLLNRLEQDACQLKKGRHPLYRSSLLDFLAAPALVIWANSDSWRTKMLPTA